MVLRAVSVILIFLYVFPTETAPRAGCTISINRDLTEPQPLVLRPSGVGKDAFFTPNNGDTITLSESQLVDLACSGSTLLLSGTSSSSAIGQARCTSGSFSIGGRTLPFSGITCSVIPSHTARYTGNTCESGYREIEIGFIVSTRFVRIMRICFDSSAQNTAYSEFNLTKTIAGFQTGFPRPNFIQGSFYSLNGNSLDTLYTRNRQRTTINSLLGLASTSYKYIAETSDLFLSRGHLTAKTDFLYGSQHRATFHFVNVAPQWQTFNGQNWESLEGDVRNFASNRGLDLTVYTGTYGVTTLPHETTGQDIELYLFVNGAIRGVPVPRLYWKVLYEPITKAGVVFLGVNNPYVLNRSKDIICTDISSQYSWLTWRASNVTLGYSYTCSVADFRRTVTTLPTFEVTQLLK